MFKLLVVEDEKAAQEYICNLIKLYCVDFEVCGIAENGLEALDKIPLTNPDLIITDVKMPVMDGIALVRTMKESGISIPTLILSSFQDFDYVRQVLDTGVLDYLVKPVIPAKLISSLSGVMDILAATRKSNTIKKLETLLWEPTGIINEKYSEFSDKLFRFGLLHSGGYRSGIHLIPPAQNSGLCENGLYHYPGRNGLELCCLAFKDEISRGSFRENLLTHYEKENKTSRVLICLDDPVPAQRLGMVLMDAFEFLEKNLIPGESAVYYSLDRTVQKTDGKVIPLESLLFALKYKEEKSLNAFIDSLISVWDKKKTTFKMIEIQLNRIFHKLRQYGLVDKFLSEADIACMIEEGLVGSYSYSDIQYLLRHLIMNVTAEDHSFFDGVSPPIFREIKEWVRKHYTDPLTIEDIGNQFRISGSYVCKLFRKNTGQSFIHYINSTRIEVAKNLLRKNPNLLLKQVADYVGFKDPYYFSRVFKSLEGISPKQYRKT